MKNKDNIEQFEKLKVRKNIMNLKNDIDVALTNNYDFVQKRAELNRIFDINMKTILAVCTLGVAATFNGIVPDLIGVTGIFNTLTHIGITAVSLGAGGLIYKEFKEDAINQVFGNKTNYKIAKEEYKMRRDEVDEKIDELMYSVSNANDEKLYDKCEEYISEDNAYYHEFNHTEELNQSESTKVRSLIKYKCSKNSKKD